MPIDQLRASADSMLVLTHRQDALLRAAMRRIAELEVKHALLDCQAAAGQLTQQRKQPQLHPILHWFARWRLRAL